MKKDDFIVTINNESPKKDWPETLKSLWWDKKGDWNIAHSIAQKIPTIMGSAIHAYLHREEGVLWNADYWYQRAEKKRPDISLDDEWEELFMEVLKSI